MFFQGEEKTLIRQFIIESLSLKLEVCDVVNSATASSDGEKHNTHNPRWQKNTTHCLLGALSPIYLLKCISVWSLVESISPHIIGPHLESHVFMFLPLVLSKSVSREVLCLTVQSTSPGQGAVSRVGRHVGKLRYTAPHRQKEHGERVALTQGWLCLPKEPWEMSGDIFGWYNWRKRALLAIDGASHLIMTGQPHDIGLSGPKCQQC